VYFSRSLYNRLDNVTGLICVQNFQSWKYYLDMNTLSDFQNVLNLSSRQNGPVEEQMNDWPTKKLHCLIIIRIRQKMICKEVY
jgi:hypothetical protein